MAVQSAWVIHHGLTPGLQVAEPKKAPKNRKGRRAAVAEAADVHAEEIEIIDDEEEGADSGASQVQPPSWSRTSSNGHIL